MKKLLLVLFSFVALASYSQINSNLYFSNNLQQARWLNPSKSTNFGFALGTGLSLDFGHTGPSFYDTFGVLDGSSAEYPFSKNYNWERFEKNLNNHNEMMLLAETNLLNVFFKVKTWSFSFGVGQKVNTQFSFNKHIIRFLRTKSLNEFIDHIQEIAGLGLNHQIYSEMRFGVAKQIGKKWSVGVTPKLLFGHLDYSTNNSLFDIRKATSVPNSTQIIADYNVNFSTPFVSLKEFRYDTEKKEMVIKTEEEEVDIKNYLTNPRNLGFGLDLGVSYQATEKLDFQFSLLDLGYIHWKDNTGEINIKGNYVAKDIPFEEVVVIDIDNPNVPLVDSIAKEMIDEFQPTYKATNYKTTLNTKALFGVRYKFNKVLSLGGLYQAVAYKNEVLHTGALTGMLHLNRWFELSASYALNKYASNNVGLGLTVKAAFLQFYLMTDNIMTFIKPKESYYTNLKLGLNITFGARKKEKRETDILK